MELLGNVILGFMDKKPITGNVILGFISSIYGFGSCFMDSFTFYSYNFLCLDVSFMDKKPITGFGSCLIDSFIEFVIIESVLGMQMLKKNHKITLQFSYSSKRKKSKDVANNRSTKSKTSSFEEKLDVVLDALSTKSTQTFPPNNPSPTIADCMDIVITFPGFDEGSKKYSQALRVFIKKQNREAFMYPTTDEAKMEFLKLLMEE
ncbi:hypothetical protein L1987_87938 [Smallanthus sonchifolius]|nr:hypothetical protein L1987_87938 [Smallanthus sonchifolius]